MNNIILFLISTFKIVSASHFFGGSISWKPLDQNITGNIDIVFQFRFYYDIDRYSCNEADILANKLIANNEAPIVSTTGASFQIQSGIYCTDYSTSWSGGQNSEIITLNQSISNIEATFSSGNWITLAYGGGFWELRVKVNLIKRKDNNRTNSSPIALMSPLTIIPLNYTSIITIPTRDPDSDAVKCRWALASLRECAGVCYAVPDASIDEENCTITFRPETEGYYVVAIQIEDFYNISDTSPISSIPLQFMLYVENRTIEEELDPIEFYYITPDEGSSFILQYNQSFHGQIVINSSSEVTELLTLSPMGLWKSKINVYNSTLDLWYVNFTWTHLETGQEGLNLFCFQAKNILGQSTELRCINLVGGITPRIPKPKSSTPLISAASETLAPITVPVKYTLTTILGLKNEEEKKDWIIPLSVSLGIFGLLSIFGLVSLILYLKFFKKNKVHNYFDMQYNKSNDLEVIVNRDENVRGKHFGSEMNLSRELSSETTSSSVAQGSTEKEKIIKKKKEVTKRFCVICGKSHITGFYYATNSNGLTHLCSHEFPAYNTDPNNEIYLKKGKKNFKKKQKHLDQSNDDQFKLSFKLE